MAHTEQIEFCTEVKSRYPNFFHHKFVLDIGSLDINGNNGFLFDNCLYLGIDVATGRNVDIVSKGHELNLPDGTFDCIISTECFEHDQYYAQTIQNILRMLKPGGMFMFTCATDGRPEHGTKRTSPQDAPLIQDIEMWGDYYKNLTESDIREIIDVDQLFSEYSFSVNKKSKDLYFFGIKNGTLSVRSDYSFLIQQHNFSNTKEFYNMVELLQNNLESKNSNIIALQKSLRASEEEKSLITVTTYEQIKRMQQHLSTVKAEIREIERTYTDKLLEAYRLFEEKREIFEEQNKSLQKAIEQAQVDKAVLITNMTDKERKRSEEQAERERKLLVLAHNWEKAYIGLSLEIETIQQSISWRITSPMRTVTNWLLSKKEQSTKIFSSNTNNNVQPLKNNDSYFNKLELNISSREESMPSQYKDYSHIKSLDELLALYDEDFVNAAYQLLLKRNPDAEGLQYYLNRIRKGINKIDILGQFRASSEGRNISEPLAGLDSAICKYKRSQWPIVGGLFSNQTKEMQLKLHALENKLYNMNADATSRFDYLVKLLGEPNATIETKDRIFDGPDMITREEFDAEAYYIFNPDVRDVGIDPYEHYIEYGKNEGRTAVNKKSGIPQLSSINEEESLKLSNKINLWTRQPLISIVMPVYNTSEVWLRQAIDSVLNQIYPHWELCIADDASPQSHVKKILDEYQQQDPRIKVIYKDNNGGVSAASNSALGLATGEYVALLDHDDFLEPDALFYVAESIIEDYPDMIYTDEIIMNSDASKIINYAFRPQFSLELLRSHPYIVHLVVFRTQIIRKIGGFNESLNISQDYDLILRVAEVSKHIVHIPKALYRWRTHENSLGHGQLENVSNISKKILTEHLVRSNESGIVMNGKQFNFFETRYTLENNLRVAIIIPTKNHGDLVRQCIESIQKTVSGIEYDIIVIDHASNDKESIRYFEEIAQTHTVLQYEGEFNFSAINNWAIDQLTREYTHYLLCNNDIEAIHDGWLERMLELGQKSDIGIVGAKLYYPNGTTIQHAGVCVGMFGAAEHYGKFLEKDLSDDLGVHPGYLGSLITNHEMSAVTAACMLIRRDAFENVSGMDELAKVGFGDVDLCLRVGQAGYRIVFCPHAELIHHESFSRGKSTVDPHPEDSAYYINRWKSFIANGDPFYNPNLTLSSTYWELKNPEAFNRDKEKMVKRRSYRTRNNKKYNRIDL